MDLSKLSPAEKIIAGSAVALLLISFFPWFGLGNATVDAWDNLLSSFAVLIGIVMLVQVFLTRFSTAKLPKLPIGWGQVHLLLGALALLLVLIQLLVGDDFEVNVAGVTQVSADLERKIGVFLGLAAAAGLAYGGFRKSKEPETATGFMP